MMYKIFRKIFSNQMVWILYLHSKNKFNLKAIRLFLAIINISININFEQILFIHALN